jgi:predicted TIM-barrel fold metal-dependent hydrolase
MRWLLTFAIVIASCGGAVHEPPQRLPKPPPPPPAQTAAETANGWRARHKLIDLHEHIDPTPVAVEQAVKILDASGIGVAVNLSGGTVTHKPNQVSELESTKRFMDERAPGRFLQYMNLDYAEWELPDFGERAAKQIEEGKRLGAAGFKEFKRLGLYLKDKSGKLIAIDDPKLDPVWKKCGELGMPVSIHVADPKAFWLPYDDKNERWIELKDHKSWWFGDPKKYPPREDLLAALDRVITRHPETTFVAVHFANNAEDLDWVEKSLDSHPNMMADLAARIPEIGRHDPDKVRKLFMKHQERIFFATDFQIGEKRDGSLYLILGSGGDGPSPTEAEALVFFQKHWRFLETNDRDFEHMTPIQGSWKISGIGLPATALQNIYFSNAERLLAKPLVALRMRR